MNEYPRDNQDNHPLISCFPALLTSWLMRLNPSGGVVELSLWAVDGGVSEDAVVGRVTSVSVALAISSAIWCLGQKNILSWIKWGSESSFTVWWRLFFQKSKPNPLMEKVSLENIEFFSIRIKSWVAEVAIKKDFPLYLARWQKAVTGSILCGKFPPLETPLLTENNNLR